MSNYILKLPSLVFRLIKVTIDYLLMIFQLWRMDEKSRDEKFMEFHVKSHTDLSPIKHDVVGVTIGSWEMYKYMLRKNIDIEFYEKYCQVGLSAPNPYVIEVSGKVSKPIMKERKLLSFSNSLRPLVINFGSCT